MYKHVLYCTRSLRADVRAVTSLPLLSDLMPQCAHVFCGTPYPRCAFQTRNVRPFESTHTGRHASIEWLLCVWKTCKQTLIPMSLSACVCDVCSVFNCHAVGAKYVVLNSSLHCLHITSWFSIAWGPEPQWAVLSGVSIQQQWRHTRSNCRVLTRELLGRDEGDVNIFRKWIHPGRLWAFWAKHCSAVQSLSLYVFSTITGCLVVELAVTFSFYRLWCLCSLSEAVNCMPSLHKSKKESLIPNVI